MAAGETGQPWTDQENDLIVSDYFSMLNEELSGQAVFKSAHREALASMLPARNQKSIEFKHMNVSAVMLGLGQPWITGYPPAANFQLSLVDAVLRWIDAKKDWLLPKGVSASTHSRPAPFLNEEPALWIGPPPTFANTPSPVDPKLLAAIARKVDVAERDARNRLLGDAGEERVLRHEYATLKAAGRDDLARRIRWTAKEDGDGYGYDVASFELNGNDRLIEVKTTNGWERTPFHISSNEIAVANEQRQVWCLMRLYDFAKTARAFEIRPPLERHVELTPTSFRASFTSPHDSQ